MNIDGDNDDVEEQTRKNFQALTKPTREKGEIRGYISYKPFLGRFGNQIQQLEYMYRIAQLTKRHLLLPKGSLKETYLGLPLSIFTAETEFSLWDVSLLKSSPVQLIYENDQSNIFRQDSNLSQNCIWNNVKFIIPWILKANSLSECQERLHFDTSSGIINQYRVDTRQFGIFPLSLFHYLFPKKQIIQLAEQFVNIAKTRNQPIKSNIETIGYHARTYREARSSQEKVIRRVCGPGTENLPKDILRDLRNRENCQCEIKERDDSGRRWTESLMEIWNKTHLGETCTTFSIDTVSNLLGRSKEDLKKYGFILATDHEDSVVDELFENMGAIMFNKQSNLVIPYLGQHNKYSSSFGKQLLLLLIDLTALMLTDKFVGVPLSSLTRAVCYWRMAQFDKQDEMCRIIMLRSYSPRCTEDHCTSPSDVCCHP